MAPERGLLTYPSHSLRLNLFWAAVAASDAVLLAYSEFWQMPQGPLPPIGARVLRIRPRRDLLFCCRHRGNSVSESGQHIERRIDRDTDYLSERPGQCRYI